MLNGNNNTLLTFVNVPAFMDCFNMKFIAVPFLFLILPGIALAEVPMRQRVVDLVILEDGTRLLGAVTSNKRGQPVQLLLRGSWLQSNAPEILERTQDSEQDTKSPDGVAQLVQQHIATLRSASNVDENRIGYLEERLIDLSAQTAAGPADVPDLVLLSLPTKSVRRVIVQSESAPQLATISILNQVDDVESIARKEVVQQLQQIPVGQRITQLPDLQPAAQSDEAAQRQFQRLLLNTDRALGTTCKLIYQSGRYLSETNSSAADLQALTAEMMLGQVQSQLQSLLNEDFGKPAGSAQIGSALQTPSTLPASAVALANNEKADVVEVTQMALNPSQGAAKVSISLYGKQPLTGDWKLVTTVQGQATNRDVTAGQQQKIADDARVQQITQLFSGLGVSGTNISSAVSIGASVEVAQQRARKALQDELAGGTAEEAAASLRILRGTLADDTTK